MSDYMVGKKGSGAKDRYMVGWNEGKSAAYKVGGGGGSVGQASNSKLGGSGLDPVVGSKSAFNHQEPDAKDVGDKSENMNFGGSVSSGAPNDPTGPGGQVKIEYSEKGDWSDKKDAMARRKANMEAAQKYYSKNSQFDSPTADIISVKKG